MEKVKVLTNQGEEAWVTKTQADFLEKIRREQKPLNDKGMIEDFELEGEEFTKKRR